MVTFSQIRDILDSLNFDSQQVESNNKLDNTLSNGIKTPPKKEEEKPAVTSNYDSKKTSDAFDDLFNN